MLSLQHLTVSLGSRVALRDVSFDVEPGDVLCVIGEEGSGKTTLLKLLTRELQPNEGVIKIDGAILSQLPREVLRMYREKIGYLDENATLDDTLTIERNIALPLDVRGVPAPERDRAVADLLKRFHLAGVAHMRPSTISRGERQLAAFARSIVTGPLIAVLDEPFQGLGDESAALAAGLLQNMQKKGTTVIVASAESRTAGLFKRPRVVRLQRGKVIEDAAPAPSNVRMREIAQAATADLVERAQETTVTPVTIETDVPERAESSEKKKVRITAVGSL